MLVFKIFIPCVLLSISESYESKPYTLSFCTNYEIQYFNYVQPNGEIFADDENIAVCKRYYSEPITHLESLKTDNSLENLKFCVYTIQYNKPQDDIILVMLDELKRPSMYIKTSSCSVYEPDHNFEFVRSLDDLDPNNQKVLIYKELKVKFLNYERLFVISDSNLDFMKSLLNIELISINCEIKNKLLNPMIKIYEKIEKDEEINQVSEKFKGFFSALQDLIIMKKTFLIYENVNLNYFDGDDKNFENDEIIESEMKSVSKALDNIVSKVKNIIFSVKYTKVQRESLQVLIGAIDALKNLKVVFRDIYKLKMNIQEEEFYCLVTGDDKIKTYFNFLKLYYTRTDIIIMICELEKDYYDNFPCDEKFKKGKMFFFQK